MAYAVNEGPTETLAPDNSVVLLIDHQVGLALWVRDQSPEQFKSNVLGLAKAAKTLGVPTIVSTSRDWGPNGQLLPELRELLADTPVIRRTGTINAYRWPEFREALEATGRRNVIVARRLEHDLPAVPGTGHGRRRLQRLRRHRRVRVRERDSARRRDRHAGRPRRADPDAVLRRRRS